MILKKVTILFIFIILISSCQPKRNIESFILKCSGEEQRYEYEDIKTISQSTTSKIGFIKVESSLDKTNNSIKWEISFMDRKLFFPNVYESENIKEKTITKLSDESISATSERIDKNNREIISESRHYLDLERLTGQTTFISDFLKYGPKKEEIKATVKFIGICQKIDKQI